MAIMIYAPAAKLARVHEDVVTDLIKLSSLD
jgi:hypothetical protein